ncbi:RHS repeat protein [Salmonella enterica]|nr:RHS repeat protein [Salmonella enterica]
MSRRESSTLYHCDHRGLPLVLIDVKGRIAWRAECDEWGNMLRENNPDNLQQLIRLPDQQYDEESGLHYNRHRYYDPGQERSTGRVMSVPSHAEREQTADRQNSHAGGLAFR